MATWTDEQILRWTKDAEEDIISRVHMRFQSFSIPIEAGTSVYSFNQRIFKPVLVTWKGFPLNPTIGRELHAKVPKFRDTQGRPVAYQMSNDGIDKIRIVPVPDESIPEYTTGLYDTNIRNAFIIRAFVYPDHSLDYVQLPDYFHRNLIRYYVLARAFHAEGIGQNLKAAEWYQDRYFRTVDKLKEVKSNYYLTKERVDIEPDLFGNFKKKHPRLAPDFVLRKPVLDLPLSFKDSMEMLDSVELDFDIDPSIQLVSVLDSLNNWADSVSLSQLGNVQRSVLDSLNNWSDNVNTDLAAFSQIPTLGLVADYRITEGSGQTLVDHSGNGNNGTLGATSGSASDDPSWSSSGGETTLLFNGNGQHCALPDMTASITAAGTFCMVIRLNSATPAGGSNGICRMGNGTTANAYPHPSVFDLRLDILRTGTIVTGITGYSSLASWHVLLITSDGSAWTVYFNNSQIFTTSGGFGFTTTPIIGSSTSSVEMVGQIARCLLWNRVLNSDERLAVFNRIKIDKPGLGIP